MRLWPLVALLLLAPIAARAGDLVVSVRTPGGQPVADAVVTVPAPHSAPIRFAWPYRMPQHNLQFDPFVLIVPVGAEVAFPNLDNVRHHVYSFSPAHPFELKLYGRDETRIVRFDKAGVVAFILVVDTPYAAKTDAAGQAVIHGVPPGSVTVKLWRPYLRAPGETLSSTVVVPREGAGRATFTAALRAPPETRHMY